MCHPNERGSPAPRIRYSNNSARQRVPRGVVDHEVDKDTGRRHKDAERAWYLHLWPTGWQGLLAGGPIHVSNRPVQRRPSKDFMITTHRRSQ